MSASKPHKAIINVQLSVYDVLDSGECSGKTVPNSKLKEYGLGKSCMIIVSAEDQHHCLMKVKTLFEKLNERI